MAPLKGRLSVGTLRRRICCGDRQQDLGLYDVDREREGGEVLAGQRY